MIFDSFEGTDLIVAILDRTGSYVASRLDVFESVFADQRILDELCRRIDDGHEPLITHIDSYLLAAKAVTSGLDNIGYAVILLPACTFEKSFGCLDYIEIILDQFSLLAGLLSQNQQLQQSSKAELASFAGVN
jgi:hypothetical protein